MIPRGGITSFKKVPKREKEGIALLWQGEKTPFARRTL
jgi:hypothetical protein